MLELAEEVLKQVGGTSKLTYLPLPQDDPQQRKPDISLAKEKLDWGPRIDLQEGVKRTIAHFREELGK